MFHSRLTRPVLLISAMSKYCSSVCKVFVALIHVLSYAHDYRQCVASTQCLLACSVHAASVLQMMHMLLCHGGVLKSNAMSKAQYMSSYWSAITHDFEHGGLNNDFLIKTASPWAILYNDQSPLENHHCAAAAQLLFEPQYQYIQVSLASCSLLLPAHAP